MHTLYDPHLLHPVGRLHHLHEDRKAFHCSHTDSGPPGGTEDTFVRNGFGTEANSVICVRPRKDVIGAEEKDCEDLEGEQESFQLRKQGPSFFSR